MPTEPVAGRECGSCSLCCKVVAVPALNKAAGQWCAHCDRGRGCRIYAERPQECRTYFCHWMVEPGLGEDWKPERAKFALLTTSSGITAFVDPGYATAWRQAPYYQTLKRWAAEGLRKMPPHLVSIRIGARGIVVLPDRDVDLGVIADDETVLLKPGPSGLNVEKIKRGTAG